MTRAARMAAVVAGFDRRTVVVVGDVIDDEYLIGRPARVSREAPVIILRFQAREARLGGAANAAHNVRALGARVLPVGVVGGDAAGSEVLALFRAAGIATDGVVSEPGRTTPTKTRILAGGYQATRQQVVRLDREPSGDLAGATEAALADRLAALAEEADAIVVSDYGYGTVTPRLFELARGLARRRGVPIVAFLTDPFMHALGLHGRAAIPLVAGAGCHVPGIMGTRVLATMRERILAGTLVCLAPCSARTAVIAGAVARFVGWPWAVAIYGVVVALGFGSGWALNRVLPGRSMGLVMEMFPFRVPCLRTMLARTWTRFGDFVRVAAPLVVAGSLVLGALYETGMVWALAVPLRPVVEGWLGLPAVAGLTLVFGVLRKELALQLLLTLAVAQHGAQAAALTHFMSANQIFTFALVNTLAVPCVATIAVLSRELGWVRALLVSAFTVVLALAAGGVAHRLLPL